MTKDVIHIRFFEEDAVEYAIKMLMRQPLSNIEMVVMTREVMDSLPLGTLFMGIVRDVSENPDNQWIDHETVIDESQEVFERILKGLITFEHKPIEQQMEFAHRFLADCCFLSKRGLLAQLSYPIKLLDDLDILFDYHKKEAQHYSSLHPT